MEIKTAALANRFEGRLFSEDGRLYFVIDVDTDSGFARVSYRADGMQQVKEMSISEVGLRLSAGANLLLDGMNSAEKSGRILQKPDGWFFTTRDGPSGPYQSDSDAAEALSEYILAAQSSSVVGKDRVGLKQVS